MSPRMSLNSLLTRLSCGYDNYTIFLVAGYCLTSSLLSILNKFAVLHFPYPAALTGFQYALSAFTVIVLCAPGAARGPRSLPGAVLARPQATLTRRPSRPPTPPAPPAPAPRPLTPPAHAAPSWARWRR